MKSSGTRRSPDAREVHPQTADRPRGDSSSAPGCGRVLKREAFAKNRSAKDGLYSICKEDEAADRRKAKERRAAAAAETEKAAKPKRTRSRRKPTA